MNYSIIIMTPLRLKNLDDPRSITRCFVNFFVNRDKVTPEFYLFNYFISPYCTTNIRLNGTIVTAKLNIDFHHNSDSSRISF